MAGTEWCEFMNKKVERLNHGQIRYVYQNFLKKDFPDNERKPLAVIEKAVKKETYDCFGLFVEEEICGYAFFVRCENEDKKVDYLFDYLAIKKELRDQGWGSIFLKMLKEYFPDGNSMLGEVENPDHTVNPDERNLQTRRLQFYLRNGIRDTGVTARVFGVEYRILEYVLTDSHSEEQVKEIYSKIYRSILPGWIYRSKIRIYE